jgi:PAS domain S-box-containing protein
MAEEDIAKEQYVSEATSVRQVLAVTRQRITELEAILESASDGIYGVDMEGRCSFINKAATELLGYRPEELIGKNMHELVHYMFADGSSYPEGDCPIVQSFLTGQNIRIDDEVLWNKVGSMLQVEYSSSPIIEGGKVTGAVVTFRDISERKRLEAELHEQAEVIDVVNRVGRILSAELDLQKLVQAVTDAATELTGAQFGSFFYNIIDEEGERYTLYTLSGVPHEHFENFPMPRNTELFGPTFRGEGIIRSGDIKKDPRYGKNPPFFGMPPGHLPVTSYMAVPVISRSGEIMGGLFFGHSRKDVFAEREERLVIGLAAQAAIAMDNARLYKKANEAFIREQEARKEAENASRLKDEFLATCSHELRTPLTSMLGWIRMLRAGKLDDVTSMRALEVIERNVKSQAQLIEDLLDISRITTGKLRLDIRLVDLDLVIKTAIDALRPAADAKGIRVQIVLDSGVGSVSGDHERLQQIVWNLLSNAIKFTPRGGRVQVRLERTGSYIEIVVSDNGKGIAPEFLPYVFDRFTQADSTITRTHGGLGMGLAIVKHLTELHGGTIEASSKGIGCGATFTVKLPIMPITAVTGNRPEVEWNNVSDESFSCPTELNGLRVLIVDDEPDTCEMIKVILEQCNAEVKTAFSVTEALEILKHWMPAVLVSDIGMPGENGYDLIRKVREYESEGKRIPAVALTAFARIEDRIKALSAGFQMHVPKPVEPAELISIIASLTSLRK